MSTQRSSGPGKACALSVLAALIPTASAPSQQVPLGYAAPEDAHFYVHGVTSKNPDPLIARFEKAATELADSGIVEDILDFATMEMSGRQRREVRAGVERAFELIALVDWQLLSEREMVVAYRLAMPMPEYLFCFRVPEARVAGQVDGARKLLVELAGMAGLPETAVRDVEHPAGRLAVFEVGPVEVAAGSVGDVFLLSTNSRMAGSAMKRLAKGDGKGSLVASKRYQTSLSHLPKATEDTIYVDLDGLMGFVGEIMESAEAAVANQGDADAVAGVNIMSALFQEFDFIDHVIATTVSDGATVTHTSRVQLKPDSDSILFATAFGRQQPWKNWSSLVPADATQFYFDTGCNPVALCDFAIGLVKENVEGAGMPLAILEKIRKGVANISGEFACVSLPKTGPGGCPLGDCVAFVRLEKSDGVLARVKGLLDGLTPLLASRGQKMKVTESQGVLGVRLDAFPWIRPSVTVRDDCLVIATSSAAIAKVDRVRAGKEPSIRSRQEFTRLGVGGDGAAEYLAYGRVDASHGLSNLLGAAGFLFSMLPDDHDTRMAIKLGTILTKLAPACRQLEMGYDWATEILPTQFPDAFMSRVVTRYR